MRKLCLMDAFAVARIIKTAELRQEIVAFATEMQTRNEAGDTGMNVEKIGFEFIITLISAAANTKVEEEIYKLYANIKDCDPDEVKKLSFEEVKADITQLIEENDLKNFFQSASSLISKA